MRRLPILLIVLTVLGAGCADRRAGDGPSPGTSGTSGIEGTVFLGPQCPVLTENSPCPDRPTQASVEVRSNKQQVITTVRTDQDGSFRISLQPGHYVLEAVPLGDRGITFSKPQDVTVVAGEYTRIDLLLDTGIR